MTKDINTSYWCGKAESEWRLWCWTREKVDAANSVGRRSTTLLDNLNNSFCLPLNRGGLERESALLDGGQDDAIARRTVRDSAEMTMSIVSLKRPGLRWGLPSTTTLSASDSVRAKERCPFLKGGKDCIHRTALGCVEGRYLTGSFSQRSCSLPSLVCSLIKRADGEGSQRPTWTGGVWHWRRPNTRLAAITHRCPRHTHTHTQGCSLHLLTGLNAASGFWREALAREPGGSRLGFPADPDGKVQKPSGFHKSKIQKFERWSGFLFAPSGLNESMDHGTFSGDPAACSRRPCRSSTPAWNYLRSTWREAPPHCLR